MKSAIEAVVLSSAGLLWAATIPITRGAITSGFAAGITVASVLILLTRKVESLWVILGAAALQLTVAALRLL